ncbi:MAG: IPTL-CTERM sorting domain-containing protein [Phycisphaerales bacterium]|nr:IPTL-CTERM sorting domain-containing protein [Phycisphaerales bacterium]
MKLPNIVIICVVSLAAISPSATIAQNLECCSLSRFDNILRQVNPSSGSTIQTQVLTLTGETIVGARGLAWDGVSGQLYGLLELQGQVGAELVTITQSTGACTSLGDTGDTFGAIAFDSAGTLYGLTGAGSATPRTLFTLSLVDATPTFALTLTGGGGGEALAYNPDDGLLYRASGGIGGAFQTIDPNAGFMVSDISFSGDDHGVSRAMKYEGPGSNSFLLAGSGNMLHRITTGGAVSVIGSMDHTSKGLALKPENIPTLGQWGLIILTLLLLTAATILFHRRAAVATG